MQAIGIIPARLASTRLPRKLLLNQTGKTLLEHTWRAARGARSLSELVIAADHEEIASAARSFGARCVMTGEHPSGTDRIGEVVRREFPDVEIVVNVQGDEPELDPAQIDLAVGLLRDEPSAQMSTLAAPIRTRAELDSPSCVKVVCGKGGRALYFSRHPIPYCRDANVDALLAGETPWRLHVGLYAYRREFLLELTTWPMSRLESLEKLEQLRALEAGAVILVGTIEHRAVGIDTPDDYARFVARWNQRSRTQES
jgi:3-deoxy-manno-octulosonate cytidylyltransferase (CMP-KDO synthetase)